MHPLVREAGGLGDLAQAQALVLGVAQGFEAAGVVAFAGSVEACPAALQVAVGDGFVGRRTFDGDDLHASILLDESRGM